MSSLVLTRKENQSIHIDDDIVIWIDKTSSSRVKVTIEAPKDIKILRGELLEGVVVE